MENCFSIAHDHRPKDGLTISTPAGITSETSITFFSLGEGTDISAEKYDRQVLYIASYGCGIFHTGLASRTSVLSKGDALFIKPHTLCGISAAESLSPNGTGEGFVYTEIMPVKELTVNSKVKTGEVFALADLVPYENGSIVNMDVASNDSTKFVVMAFDEGCALEPHRAPGDALVFALEGKAVIGYEGKEYPIQKGENFRFEKNGLHSVKADGRFKMALLLTLK